MPSGAYGPAFLATENFKVIRLYNTSDLYALFVSNPDCCRSLESEQKLYAPS